MDLTKLYIYDLETYKEAFTFSIIRSDGKHKKTFECSKFVNEIEGIFKCLNYLRDNECYMVGFNSVNFDYPVLHEVVVKKDSLPKTGKGIASFIFKQAQKQIESFRDGQFGNTIKSEDQYVKQIDLFKVHHFDNKARMTSLKLIEFNLRMDDLVDLPYGIESELTREMIDKIKSYNEHDVHATRLFFLESLAQVDFRFQLTERYGRNFLNHNDGKIGKDYFQMRLEESGVKLHTIRDGKRVMKQTKRPFIKIEDCLFDYYDFKRPEFIAVKDWFSKQTICETKGVFSDIEEHNLGELAKYAQLETKKKKFKTKPTDAEVAQFKKDHPLGWIEEEELKATEYAFDDAGNHILEHILDSDGCPDLSKKPKKKRVPKKSYWGCWKQADCLNMLAGGLKIDFGVGGIHASLESKVARETKTYMIRDADVSSMYPNIAIANRIYPEHLGEQFCDIYHDVYEQRKSYPKGSAENAMLKLSLNSVYGDSNNKFSVFYDPMYTMSITINGQLSLLLLAEKLLEIDGLRLIQLNTDGITVALLRGTEEQYKQVCDDWQKQVGLQLEYADYSKMIIRDVNNYIAVYTDGKLKRKGAYQYEGLGWHQNQGGLVIAKAAEAEMLHGVPVRDFIAKHLEDPENKWDFLLRAKIPRSSKLVLVQSDDSEVQQQNVCRYYISTTGGKLVKLMPALEAGGDDRRLSIDSAWKVRVCNKMVDTLTDIDVEYYALEAEKLVIK